jgi:hypothetical protein
MLGNFWLFGFGTSFYVFHDIVEGCVRVFLKISRSIIVVIIISEGPSPGGYHKDSFWDN